MSTTQPTVSILTPTTTSRCRTLILVAECVAAQTYKCVLEWVVVDATQNQNTEVDFLINAVLDSVERRFRSAPLIRRIRCPPHRCARIGMVRNFSNEQVSGEVVVCFDDDDFYPTCRVSHAVEMLVSTKKQIAGCSSMLLYHCDIRSLVRYCFKHQNHSTNNAMAYTREYAVANRYDEDVMFAEEKSFTNTWQSEMVQLVCEKSVVQMGHSKNTYNKLHDILMSYHVDNGIKTIPEDEYPGTVDRSMLIQFSDQLCHDVSERWSEFDVAILTGPGTPCWHPQNAKLPPALAATVYRATALVASSKRVVVFTNVEDRVDVHGVIYVSMQQFTPNLRLKTLVLEPRMAAQWPLLKFLNRSSIERLIVLATNDGKLRCDQDHVINTNKNLSP